MVMKPGVQPGNIALTFKKDSLKEIQISYCAVDYLAYAERIAQACEGDFPAFVLEKRCWYVSRLIAMALEPELQRHMQALNALKLMDHSPILPMSRTHSPSKDSVF